VNDARSWSVVTSSLSLCWRWNGYFARHPSPINAIAGLFLVRIWCQYFDVFMQKFQCSCKKCFFLILHSNELCGKPRNMPRPCMPHAAAQLQPIHALRLRRPARPAPWIFMIDRQRLALGGDVDYGVVHINHVVTWTANQSGLVTWTFDLLILKLVSESHVTWATSVPIVVFLGLSILDLGPYATDRQTDVRQTDVRRQTASSLNAPLLGAEE